MEVKCTLVWLANACFSFKTNWGNAVNISHAIQYKLTTNKQTWKRTTGFYLQIAQGSTWKGFFGKLKIIGPYIWPKGSFWLQLCVVFCAALLVGGRICNLYVPIYYKQIGMSEPYPLLTMSATSYKFHYY